MKKLLYWLANAGIAALILISFIQSFKWLHSVEKTHAVADVLMYWFSLVVVLLEITWLSTRLDKRPE